jgi:hypothetical protein
MKPDNMAASALAGTLSTTSSNSSSRRMPGNKPGGVSIDAVPADMHRVRRTYNGGVGTNYPWPDLGEEGQWAIDMMEEQLRDSLRTPDEMRERAAELREEATHAATPGVRDTLLILAGRWEEAAAARVGSR